MCGSPAAAPGGRRCDRSSTPHRESALDRMPRRTFRLTMRRPARMTRPHARDRAAPRRRHDVRCSRHREPRRRTPPRWYGARSRPAGPRVRRWREGTSDRRRRAADRPAGWPPPAPVARPATGTSCRRPTAASARSARRAFARTCRLATSWAGHCSPVRVGSQRPPRVPAIPRSAALANAGGARQTDALPAPAGGRNLNATAPRPGGVQLGRGHD